MAGTRNFFWGKPADHHPAARPTSFLLMAGALAFIFIAASVPVSATVTYRPNMNYVSGAEIYVKASGGATCYWIYAGLGWPYWSNTPSPHYYRYLHFADYAGQYIVFKMAWEGHAPGWFDGANFWIQAWKLDGTMGPNPTASTSGDATGTLVTQGTSGMTIPGNAASGATFKFDAGGWGGDSGVTTCSIQLSFWIINN